MRSLSRFLIGAGVFTLFASLNATSVNFEHERLRIKNTFKNPEDVVAYYCARDASGFVWSGLLDAERRAFTLWKEAPQQDSFYIARKYQIESKAPKGDSASVDVKYELLAIGDAHGTKAAPPSSEYKVTFNLKKVDGAWKIVKPSAEEIAPVVLEAKFPVAGSQKTN